MRSDIRYRFATTQMSSVVRNVASKAQEIGFDVTLPKQAFIMAFHMTIDGQRYDGKVKEKIQAKREYQAAVDRGQSAGHVRQAPRHANIFQVAVNVAAGSAVNFTLTYQEVLHRRLGIYEHEIHVSPGQPVEDFRIEVNILENRPLKFVRTPALRTDVLLTNLVDVAENQMTVVDRPSPESARVLYAPSLSQQGEKAGISARFAVQYDVEHAGPRGDVLVVDGYFVHFMAPDTLSHTLPKDIIFVLDVSGSMYGTKIEQLRVAMKTILSDLKPKDRFNIITFSSGTTKWKEGLVQADENSINSAQNHVEGMRANGMTNINDALLEALSEMKDRHNKERVGMIFFLTDGHPTEGESDPKKIARNILNANERTVAIFGLAFGEGADYESLKSLSAQNLGFARKIYEASDAALQVSSLYDEISAVSIKDMSITYQKSSVDEFSLTETDFPMVFNGSEIMICGLLKEDTKTLTYQITGLESMGDINIRAEVDNLDTMVISPGGETDQLFSGPRDFSGMVERMWAYQTIRQLLRQKEKHAGESDKVSQLEKKVLDMSLKYNFVTPLTSMVVTKPDQGETEIREAEPDNGRSEESSMMKSASMAHSQPLPSSVMSRSNSMSARRVQVLRDPKRKWMQRISSPGRPGIRPKPVLSAHLIINGTNATMITKRPLMNITAKPNITATPSGSVKYSSLSLATLTLNNSASPGLDAATPLLCMVPRRWKYGKVNLLSGPNNIRLVLTQCNRRQCPKQPSLKTLRIESSRRAVTEIWLNGADRWRYHSSSVFSVSVLSNNKLVVSGSGMTIVLEWTQQGQAAVYRLDLTVTTGQYSGLLGKLAKRPEAQLKRLARKVSRRVCKDEGSKFHVLINKKTAKKFSTKRTRRGRLGRRLRNGRTRSH